MKSHQSHYFLYVQRKGENSNSVDEQNQFEFEIENMKNHDLTRENFDILFKNFTDIDLLEDEPLQINWEGFYKRMEAIEDFEQEFKFTSMNE